MKLLKNNSTIAFSYSCKKTILTIWIVISCSIYGQDNSKKNIAAAEYERWGKLENRAISQKGNWISFDMQYSNGSDTLFVKHTQKNIVFSFPLGTQGKFGGEIAFGAFQGDKVIVTNLENSENIIISNCTAFEFANSGKIIVSYFNDGELILRNIKNEEIIQLPNVTEYQLDKPNNILFYLTSHEGKSSFGTINLGTNQKTEYYTTQNKLSGLTLAEYGKGVFWLEEGINGKYTKLNFYKTQDKSIQTFEPKSFLNFPEKHEIVTTKSFKISSDGKRVFFGIAKVKEEATPKKDDVEVWDTEDLWIYPKASRENLEGYSTLSVWFIEEKRWNTITSKELPFVQLNGSKSVALLYNPTAYAPHFKRYGEVDYFLYNLADGTKRLFLEKQPGENYLLSFSPNGAYICYFKDKNWWLYNIKTQSTVSIVPPAGSEWVSNDLKYITRPHVFGMKGWSDNGEYLLLQDEFDVYQFYIKTNNLKRITNGRESGTYFTVDGANIKQIGNDNYNGWALTEINSDNDLIVSSRNATTKAQQFKLVSTSNTLIPVANNDTKSDELRRVNNEVYVYREQSHKESPRIVSFKNGVNKVLFESNNHDKNFNQGKVELISFSNSKGDKLQGLLYYPVNYEAGKKYPMIINVYSQITNSLHEYCIPTLYNDTGFNVKHFVQQNYFVLMPDVKYYEGETGNSALDCVVAANNAVAKTGMIDTKHIGLIGHSFGGYETNYIITKSNIFAAAVSGAAISDMVSWYFSNSKSLNIPELWRSESQQWRIGKSIFEDKELYLKNSPILYADNVTTPLLSWVGKMETNLPYEQSLLFYNALRRAKKKNVLLVYPKDQHVIVIKENKMDLTKRITDWFDRYLKE